MDYAVLIPENWLKEVLNDKAGWKDFPSSCFFIASSGEDLIQSHENGGLNNLIKEKIVSAVIWILPKKYSSNKYQKCWPKIVQQSESQTWVNSLIFADSWDECKPLFELYFNSVRDAISSTFVSCQYEPPYTQMFETWQKSGAIGFHPGDFFKGEFLMELKNLSGNWVYFGHGEGDRLRGYGHIDQFDLLANKPIIPFNSTLWFTCSTLEEKEGSSLGLNWFFGNGTFSLLASPFKVKTSENQEFASAWLEIMLRKDEQSIAEIILELFLKDRGIYRSILSQYQLLGFPWVKMNL